MTDRLRFILFVSLLIWCVLQTQTRLATWITERTLYKDAVAKAPNSWRAHYNYAHAIQSNENLTLETILHYNRAKNLNPSHGPSYTNLGAVRFTRDHPRLGYLGFEAGALLGDPFGSQNLRTALDRELVYFQSVGTWSSTGRWAVNRYIIEAQKREKERERKVEK